jgi:hypothetical protein
MPVENSKTRVLIATTDGPVEILLLTEEDEGIGRSVACVGGTTETADIDAAYHAFVARPTGLVARLFGHSCYRIDLSARIDAGSSWQLGVLTAHALYASGRLAQEKDIASRILWATGAVRSVDLTVSAVSHLDEKVTRSLDRLKAEVAAGCEVLAAIPSANSGDLSPDMRATLVAHGVNILEIAHVESLWNELGVKTVEAAQTVTERPVETKRAWWFGTSRLWQLGVGSVALAAAAYASSLLIDRSALWRSGTPKDLRSELTTALAKRIPNAPIPYRTHAIEEFAKSKVNRAMTIAFRSQKTMRASGWPSRELAEEKSLERCQQYFDEPCALVATNDFVASGETLPLRDAPRVHYSGGFNPERIPGIAKSVQLRPDVAHYLLAAGPKASAFHAAAGILHVVTGAPSQYEAEEQALRACNDHPARTTAGGPCYLYSVDNRVVLPLRSTAPITQLAAAPTLHHDLLLTMLSQLAPTFPNTYKQVREYLESKPHKALAVLPPSHSWRTAAGETADRAEERVLEACQLRFAKPCILLAVDESVRVARSTEHWQSRPMSRISYDGLFDPMQIPAVTEETRRRADVANYLAAATYKAAAIHPWGRIFLSVQKSTQREAEETSLEACDADSDRNGKDGTCLLYAIGDLVVLPKRLTKPLSPQ